MTTSAYVLIVGLLVAIIAISILSTTPSSKPELSANTDTGQKPTKPASPVTKPVNNVVGGNPVVTPPTPPVDRSQETVVVANPPVVEPPLVPIAAPSRFPLKHTVKSGEDYTRLAKHYYGCESGREKHLGATHIQKANPGVAPDRIQIGQKITIPALTPKLAALLGGRSPAAVTSVASVATPRVARPQGPDLSAYKIYIVKRGDSLTKIARVQLGSVNKKDQLFELNKRLGLMQKIDDLKVGQQIVLGYK